MLSTVAEEYRQICEELGLKLIPEIEESLIHYPNIVDLSIVYFPSKCFDSIILLIERRCEIEKLILSEIQLSTKKIIHLFNIMQNSCISSLIIKNVTLDSKSGESLKKLCIKCESLIEINLYETMLSESIINSILTQVELNKINFEENKRILCKAVGTEAPKCWRWRIDYWEEKKSLNVINIKKKIEQGLSFQETIKKITDNRTLFLDKEFPTDMAIKNNPNIIWIRVSNLLKDSKKKDSSCLGGKPLCFSSINDTKNLCAALNVIQQITYIRKYLCVRSIPDVGLFVFRFFIKESSIQVIIDDQIPFLNGSPAGIHHSYNNNNNNNEDYWGCLVEKAFAKLHGGYDNIAGVGFGYALSLLTGGICFDINWKILKENMNETDIFRFLRDLINNKRVVTSFTIPQSEIAKLSLEENGICPFMSYIITSIEPPKSNDPYSSYAVQISSPNEIKYKNAISLSELNIKNISEVPRFWMSLPEYITYFDKTCLLLWPQSDPLTNHKYVVEHLCNCFGGSDNISTFASNPSFILTNLRRAQSEVMLVLRQIEIKNINNDWIQIHVHKPSNNGLESEKRYDIYSKNELFSTKKTFGGEVALLIKLGKDERLQITTSAFSKSKCILRATSVDNFQLIPLPSHFEYTVTGNFKKDNEFKNILTLTNVNKEKIKKIILAISQEPLKKRTSSIGIKVWKDYYLDLNKNQPILITEFKTDLISVYRLEITVEPNESITIIPFAKVVIEDIPFSLSVYSTLSLQVKEG